MLYYLYTILRPHSSYPDQRVQKDSSGQEEGVIGSVSLLQNVTVSSQPISSMDWSPDKVCTFPFWRAFKCGVAQAIYIEQDMQYQLVLSLTVLNVVYLYTLQSLFLRVVSSKIV